MKTKYRLPTIASANLVFEFVNKKGQNVRHTVRKGGIGVEVRTAYKGKEEFATVNTDESRMVFQTEKKRGGNKFKVTTHAEH